MKISYKEYCEIFNLKHPHYIQSLLIYTLSMDSHGGGVRIEFPWWLYLILFIPAHLVTAIICLWDGGLKEFEIQPRSIQGWTFVNGDVAYEKAKKIWKGD